MSANSNETKVTHGVYAGAVATVMWWALEEFAGISGTPEVVAASVVLITAAAQFVLPTKRSNE